MAELLARACMETSIAVEVQGLSNASEHLHSQQLWCRAQALGLPLQREQMLSRSQTVHDASSLRALLI